VHLELIKALKDMALQSDDKSIRAVPAATKFVLLFKFLPDFPSILTFISLQDKVAQMSF